MAGRRSHSPWCDVVGQNEVWLVGPIEQEEELMFGVVSGNAGERFEGEPPDAFQLAGQEQACVYRDVHGSK